MPENATAAEPKPLTRIEKLRQKQAQLAAQLKTLEARQSAQDRKDDTRRKIIAGSLALEHMVNNPKSEFGRKLFSLLDEYARPAERRLFEHLGLGQEAQEPPTPANDETTSLKQEFRG